MAPLRTLQVFVVAAALALSPSASATTTRPVTLVELTRSSDDVLVGTVRRSSSRWEGGFIVTDHEVEVVSALKGRLAPRTFITVRVAGGVVGRIGQTIPGAPTLEDGHTYVLFLSGGISTARYLAHMTAAVVPVTLDASGRVQAGVPSSLVMVAASGAAAQRPMAVELDTVASAVRAVAP
jgi:hypothetical protein